MLGHSLRSLDLHSFTFSSAYFDVVHSQMVCGGIDANRWSGYVRDMFRVLRPGGWCQMVEMYFNAQSDNGSLSRGKQNPTACEFYIAS